MPVTIRAPWLAGLLALQGACAFDPSTQAAESSSLDASLLADGASRPDGPPTGGRADAGADPDASPDAMEPPELEDDGLIVRYHVDEAADGRGPTHLGDSAPPALDLAIAYRMPPVARFTSQGGQRGLEFEEIPDENDVARASVQTNGTKIETALQGSTTATIEMVVDISDTEEDGGRLSHIGSGTSGGALTLRSSDTDELEVWINDSRAASFSVDYGDRRSVLHVLLDSSQQAASDRVRLFVDGIAIAPSESPGPPQDEPLELDAADTFYVIGNREVGGRGIAGTVFYAALYQEALAPAQILNNALLLASDDDAP